MRDVASEREAKRFCTYEEGMFARERWRRGQFSQEAKWWQVGFHEAGHAVSGHFFGFGLCAVVMHYSEKDEGRKFAIHGATIIPDAHVYAIRRAKTRGDRLDVLHNEAVTLAAGVAAERRYCRTFREPVEARLGAKGDRSKIDQIAACVHSAGGPEPEVFRERIWRDAQRLIANRDVWDAIAGVGCYLASLWDCVPDHVVEGEERTETFVMSGQRARAIMRKFGV